MRIRSACLRLLEWFRFRKKRYRVRYVGDVPDSPRAHEVYAIGEPFIWQAAVLCPCGCGYLIQLSLLDSDSPRWSLSADRDGSATLSPSIWRTRGCEAHFFVRKGQIIWCEGRK